MAATMELSKEDAWIAELDLKAFGRELRELGDKLRKNQGAEDVAHLNKILAWNWLFTIAGVATMWMAPNVLTIVCLSTGLYSRWVMVGHHVCHGGYDNTEAGKRGYSRWVFGVGSLMRRAIDWFDWMLPEAWNLEHGRLHHYSLNEGNDPDLVQMNTAWLREMAIPKVFKYAVAAFFAITWKWSYYSSNTYSQLLFSKKMRELTKLDEQMKELGDASSKASSGKANAKEALMAEKNERHVVTFFNMLDGTAPSWWSSWAFMTHVFLPFLLFRFVVLPMPFYVLLGREAFFNCIINLFVSDVLTNAHAFLTVVPNHAGEDLYYFEDHCEPKSDEFFLRQVIGSVDFSAGNDYVDFFHGFLNYQIEHHLWPDLSMLSYQRAHPLVKDICRKYGVPFVQHNVFWRLHKTLEIFVGTNDMRLFPKGALHTAAAATASSSEASAATTN